jgi:outer membrane protein assembly factor BamE (lipoprotein component of BamABCDE complex)
MNETKGENVMKYLMLLLVAVISLSFGCAKPYIVGTPIEKAKVDQIVPGTTPEAKIMEMFGNPEKKEMMGAGQMKYVYNYYYLEPRFWTKDVTEKTSLEVLTKNGVVVKYDMKKETIDPASAPH